MVPGTRKIVWTQWARTSRNEIFTYWNHRNKSTTYSRKINFLFQESLKQVAVLPESGMASNNENVRLKIASHFLIIYHITENQIIVLDIWDARQNPNNFPK